MITDEAKIPAKIKKVLSQNKWYHYTTEDQLQNLIENGSIADYNAGNELDFGYGFYLASSLDSAHNYMSRAHSRINWSFIEYYYILEYEFEPLQYFTHDYSFAIFNKYDIDFANFVFNNRISYHDKIQKHNYDITYGVMSDSLARQLFLKYRSKIISKDEVLTELQKSTSMKQLCIHKQSICDSLKLVDIHKYNSIDKEEEKLDLWTKALLIMQYRKLPTYWKMQYPTTTRTKEKI